MVRKGFRLHEGLAREILEALFSSPRKSPQQQSRRQSESGEWRQVQRRSKPKKVQETTQKPIRRQSVEGATPTPTNPRVSRERGSVSPDDMSVAAQEKVKRLEAAIAALGEFPDPSVFKTLQDALTKAQEGASVPPVGVRLDLCAQFVERARRRLAKAEVEFNCVQEERALRATELAEGLARLETLRAEAAVSGVPQVSPHPPQDVGHLQEVIRDLQAEEDLIRKKSRVAAPSTLLAILNGGTPQ